MSKIKIGQYNLENDVECKITCDGYEIFSDAVNLYDINPDDIFDYDTNQHLDAYWGMNGSIMIED